jgi:hypothetical protein
MSACATARDQNSHRLPSPFVYAPVVRLYSA